MYYRTRLKALRYYGSYGGAYVPEMLIVLLRELEESFLDLVDNDAFIQELNYVQNTYNGRSSPLYYAENLSHYAAQKALLPPSARIYLKSEHLNHTGAHKMNNALGQVLLAKHMGKKKVVAETGAGQHGLATAAACAKFGLHCIVFMGEEDVKRQYPNVFAMKTMGAELMIVRDGNRTLKDAVNAALKYWIEHGVDTNYVLGSALGPCPYPQMVQFFQSIIGRELRIQLQELGKSNKQDEKKKNLPDLLIACMGGGSNALGLFTEFIDEDVLLLGVEAGGLGIKTGKHASRLRKTAKVGIGQGYKSYFLQNRDGQLANTYSISAGMDYAGISPQVAYYYDQGRILSTSVTDKQALQAYTLLSRLEGIIPALESSHALAALLQLPSLRLPAIQDRLSDLQCVVVNISGRGDKDIFLSAPLLDRKNWLDYLEDRLRHG